MLKAVTFRREIRGGSSLPLIVDADHGQRGLPLFFALYFGMAWEEPSVQVYEDLIAACVPSTPDRDAYDQSSR